MIEVRGVVKRFGSKPVLRKLDLTVAEGETLALFGPNGAGKTTLMRIIATLGKPSAGRVSVGGIDTAYAPDAVRRLLGFVTHQPLLYDALSAQENLTFYGRLYQVAGLDERIRHLLRLVGLDGRRHDPVRTYSRGMVQRLTIARALLHDPPVLLLDEPDTGLDQHAALMLKQVIAEVGGAGRTILLTTHNLERGLAWADRVAILNGGKLVFDAPRASLTEASLRDTYQQMVGDA